MSGFDTMGYTAESHPHLYQLACEHARQRQQTAQYEAYLEQQARQHAERHSQRQEVAPQAQAVHREIEVANYYTNSHATMCFSPSRSNQTNCYGYQGSSPVPSKKKSPVRLHYHGQKRMQHDFQYQNPFESTDEFRENFQPTKRNRCIDNEYNHEYNREYNQFAAFANAHSLTNGNGMFAASAPGAPMNPNIGMGMDTDMGY